MTAAADGCYVVRVYDGGARLVVDAAATDFLCVCRDNALAAGRTKIRADET